MNRYTIRILDEVIPEGVDRGKGAPVVSVLDESKKDKTQKRAVIDWSREGARTGITQQIAQERLVTSNNEIKNVEKDQKVKKDAWVAADKYRHEAAVYQRQTKQRSSQHSGSTTKANDSKTRRLDQEQGADRELQAARMTSDTAFLDWMQKDDKLRSMKATRYALQRIQRHDPTTTPPRTRSRLGQTLHGRDPLSRPRRRIFTSTASLVQYWLTPLRPLDSTVMTLDSANSIPRLQQR